MSCVFEAEKSEGLDSLANAVGHAIALELGNSWAAKVAKAGLKTERSSLHHEVGLFSSEELLLSDLGAVQLV